MVQAAWALGAPFQPALHVWVFFCFRDLALGPGSLLERRPGVKDAPVVESDTLPFLQSAGPPFVFAVQQRNPVKESLPNGSLPLGGVSLGTKPG